MPELALRVLGQEFRLDCSPEEARRLTDLAAALETRLPDYQDGDPESLRRLIRTALSLMDEAQSAGAALARARREIDRLNDLLSERS